MPEKSFIQCPICGQSCQFFEKPVGPFCSERCQLIDLGKWLNEEYRYSEPLTAQHLLDEENFSP